MPSLRKASHVATAQAPRKPAKQQRGRQQQRALSPAQTVGKSNPASLPASTDATAVAAPRLPKRRRQLRSLTSTPDRSLNALPETNEATTWRAHLLRLATQEAYTAATLLRLLPSSTSADVRDGVQPNQLPWGAAVLTKKRVSRGSADGALPPTASVASADASFLPTQTVEGMSYGELWEGLLTRLPLVNRVNPAAELTPTTGGNNDSSGNTGGGRRRGRVDSVGHQLDNTAPLPSAIAGGGAKAGTVNSPAANIATMLSALDRDWRSFLLHRRQSASVTRGSNHWTSSSSGGIGSNATATPIATAGNCAHSAVPAQGHHTAAQQQQRHRLENLACSSYMTHAEQRAIHRYFTAAIATVPSSTRQGLSPICVLDFL
ncbi:hypothetical protein, conserved [Leishmania lindenbergi]|uniref:Uncharacterized protein n=1 Tax=Leishmania lindenbergi TaxID=651832 RepID=A0AAW3ATN3_9TRYP